MRTALPAAASRRISRWISSFDSMSTPLVVMTVDGRPFDSIRLLLIAAAELASEMVTARALMRKSSIAVCAAARLWYQRGDGAPPLHPFGTSKRRCR